MLKTVHDLFFKKSSSSNLQIHSLDGLRGIAILFVLLSHMSKGDLHLLPWINFSGSGTYGVFLFFVLSAFLLTLPFFEHYRHRLSEPGIWLSYALRRFFRIFPLYIIVLLVSFTFSETGNFIRLSRQDLWNHIILRDGKSILWTIPVEFKYYFFLPLVVIFFIVFLRARYGFVVVAVAAAVTIIYAFYISSGKTFSQVSLIRYFPVFLLGSLTAFTHWKVKENGGIASPGSKVILEIIALVCFIFVLILIPSVWASLFRQSLQLYYHKILLFGGLWSLFIFSYMNGTGFINRILSIKPLRFIGVVSFSIYLVTFKSCGIM